MAAAVQPVARDRRGLIGGLIVAVLGFAVNDSGIVVPAMMFSYLVPVALLADLAAPAEAHVVIGAVMLGGGRRRRVVAVLDPRWSSLGPRTTRARERRGPRVPAVLGSRW